MGKKATIIGGTGFIGRHLLSWLREKDWDCHVPGRQETYKRLTDMGHVFYCAGLTADFMHRPFDTVEAHVSLLNRILHEGKFDSLVYLSSTRLYDSQSSIQASEDLPLSLQPANPRHLYDLSKALGESLCHAAGNGRARIARLSCVYNDHTDDEGFLPGLLRQIIVKRPSYLQIDTSPAYARDYIHLDDVLKALLNIAEKGTAAVYNVASGVTIRNDELFAAIATVSGCRIVPLRHDVPPSPPTVSIQKLQDEFGLKPVPVLQKATSIIKEHYHDETVAHNS